MVSFTHDGEGTPESHWRRWEQEREAGGNLQVEELFDGRLPARFLLLAAHPDDETLGAGGLLARLSREGVRCDVVVLSDGEASHPGSPTHPPHRLAELRRTEVADALQILAPAAQLTFEGLPDGGLGHDDVTAVLRRELGDGDSLTLVAAPWRHDGHPDHDAAGSAAAEVCGELDVPLLEYPIWLWHWGTAEDSADQLATLSFQWLDAADHGRKGTALAAHLSQTLPLSDAPGDETLLSPGILEHFERNFESFFVTRGSSTFERLHRDRADPWEVAERFYEQRKRALTMAALPRRRFCRTLEIGCSVGALTRELAAVSDNLLALDTSETAVRRTNEALIMDEAATARLATVPRDWPREDGPFDLIVLSETGYFLTADQLDAVVDLVDASLDDDGVLVLCHWRHPIEGWELDGDAVHERVRRLSGLETLVLHTEEDFLLEVLVPAPASSVARREGLL
ncbi:PIG-L family deacetylase [Arthrobacter sp. MDT1-48-3]